MKKFLLIPVLFLTLTAGYKLVKPETCLATFQNCKDPVAVEEVSEIAPHYYWYTQQNFEAVATGNTKIVLFFYAPWCGTCSVLDDELKEHADRLGSDITVLKVEYDKDRIMKQKYGIVTQHTLVSVDKTGKEISKWVGGDIAKLNEMVK